MDESVVKHLEQQQLGTLKLSEAIRAGCEISQGTREARMKAWVVFRERECFACVVGAAWLGFNGGGTQREYYDHFNTKSHVSEAYGIDHKLLDTAERMYEQEGKSREHIADWLEAQGH